MVYTTETYMLIGIVLMIGVGILFLMAKRRGCSIRDLFRREYNIKFKKSKKKQIQPESIQQPRSYRMTLGDSPTPAFNNPNQIYRKIAPSKQNANISSAIATPTKPIVDNSEEVAHEMLNGEYFSVERMKDRFIIRQEDEVIYVANTEEEFHQVMETLMDVELKLKQMEIDKFPPKDKVKIRRRNADDEDFEK